MHKQLQANSKFLMGLYPREVIPLFQLPDSLGVLIMVVSTYTLHTYHTHICAYANAYHTHTQIYTTYTHCISHIHVHSLYQTHTMQHIAHATHQTDYMLIHAAHIYCTPHMPHTYTHTTQLPPTPNMVHYEGTSLCLYNQLLPHSWDRTWHYTLSLLLPPAQFSPQPCILSREQLMG